MALTPKQEEKLLKIKNALKKGDLGIIALFLELEDRLDKEIPQLSEIITRMKGDRGDDGENYVLSNEDKKEISHLCLEMIDEDSIAKKVVNLISIKEIAKYVEKPKKGIDYFTNADKKELVEEVRSKIKLPKDGKNADEEVIVKKTIKALKPEIEKLKLEPETAEDTRNKLEALQGNDRLAFDAIRESNTILKDLNELKNRPAQIIETGGGGSGLERVNTKQGVHTIDFGTNLTVTPTANGVIVNAAGGDLTPYWKSDGSSTATGDWDLGANTLTANSFIKTGGTSSQFLKADGSVDSSTYLTSQHWGTVTGGIAYASGNVGIGTITPSDTLEVNGTANFVNGIGTVKYHQDGYILKVDNGAGTYSAFGNVIGAGYFYDGINEFTICDGSYAFGAQGTAYVNGAFYTYGIYVNEFSPYDNGAVFEAYGRGGFVSTDYGYTASFASDGVYAADFYGGGSYVNICTPSEAIYVSGGVSYFTNSGGTVYLATDSSAIEVTGNVNIDSGGSLGVGVWNPSASVGVSNGTYNVYLCDPDYAIMSYGNIKLNDITNTGSGAPSSIMSTNELYVDADTGLVYLA
jgi:hypothetical protein